MEELLDKQTLAAVIAASPEIPGLKEDASNVLKHLSRLAHDGGEVISAYVQDLTDELNASEAAFETVTASHVGGILRSMGQFGRKTRNGYRYYWTLKQLAILQAALGGSHETPGG